MFGLDNLMDMLFDSAMESINRNERVIQVLKRLNLDPDHPPADFTGVYQYALVEYGVGKPRPALEIFRQTKIQELFREALERNNPSILLKNGEDFLADSPLQIDLQASNVDVRREFYAFAAVFIEVAKRTRTPAEILAQQKLESLHRQIGSLQERLNRLPTIEGLRTEMARLAAPSYPALPGSESFNTEQCKAFALAQQMRGWFETLGFDLESHEVWQDDYFEWIINIPVRRGRYDRILVRGIDGEAGLSDVEDLKQSVEAHRTDEGWLVTARRISRAARDEVEKAENEGLGCYTLDELLDQDADFSGYLTWLETEIQKRGIDQKYVPLACLKEEIDPDTQQRIGVSRYDDRDGWIDGYIDLWLDDPAKEHVSVLGEFGTGKTWFALHYAWKALQRYREAQRRGLERPRLPLVIPLRDYAKAVSVESLFSEFFFRKHEIPIPGYSAFEQLNRMGKLLLIFDGFDEMAARVDRQEMINNFWELAKVVVPGAKVILTCRTEHFPDAKEGRALLNAELQASTRDLTGETPQFEVLELEKFNDEQIRQVLEHQAQPTTVEQIMGNPQLLDLARRPVLTELILEALPDIEAGKPVDMSRVYLYAVRHKMERDIKAERTFTSMADKLYFMCELSWEMLSTDRMSINYREFPDRIRKLFGPAVQEEKNLDHWHYDMMGQTMLIRNADGDYTPAHRSFLEFFVAYRTIAALGALEADFTELLRDQSFQNERNKPRNYTWTEYFQNRRNIVNGTIEFSDFLCSSLGFLTASVGSVKFSKAFIDLAVPMIRHDAVRTKLLPVLMDICDRKEGEIAYTGRNILQLMTGKDPYSLEGVNLAKIFAPETDFTNAHLSQTNFSGANLKDCVFTKVLGSIVSLNFSRDGRFLALGDSNRTVQIWNVSTGKSVLLIRDHSDWVRSIDFSPDSQILASGSDDRTIKFWSTKDGRNIKTLVEHTDRVRSVKFNLDGTLLASGSHDKTIKIWSSSTGKCISTLEGHEDAIEAISFSLDNKLLASGSHDKTIKLWSVHEGKCINTLEGHRDIVWSVVFSPDGKILASGSYDKTIKIWSINDGHCIYTFTGHTNEIHSLAFTPDGSMLASGSKDGTVKLWSISSGECIDTFISSKNWVRSMSFSPDGVFLAFGTQDQTVQLWSVKNRQCLNTLEGYNNAIQAVAVSPDGHTLASGGGNKTIRFWSTLDGQHCRILQGHTDWIRSLSFSSSGNFIVSSSNDLTIRLWSVDDGQCLEIFKGHNGGIRSVVFSPDDELLASGSDDHTIRLWSTLNRQCLRILKGHHKGVYSVAFSPDGELIASASDDCTIRFWSVSEGKCLRILKGHEGSIRSVTFSPDGKFLASGSSDHTVWFWSVDDGKCVNILRLHRDRVNSVVTFSNKNVFVSSSHDQTIHFWDMKSGNCTLSISDQMCGGMNITHVSGLTTAQKAALELMGAIDESN